MGGRLASSLSTSSVLPRHPLVGRSRSDAAGPPRRTAEEDAFAALLARLSSLEDEVDCLVPRVRSLRAGLLRAQAAVHGGLRRIDALDARNAWPEVGRAGRDSAE